MSYTYLLASGEESSAGTFSDIPPCVLLNLTPTAGTSFCKDNGIGHFQDSPSGTMSRHLTENLGEERSMSFAEVSPAQTSVSREGDGSTSLGTLQVPAVAYGGIWRESSVRYCQKECSWKTHQHLWEEDLPWSSVTLPAWGMMQGGVVWEQTSPRCLIAAPGSGWLPTPVAGMWRGTTRNRFAGSPEYRGANLAEGLRKSEKDPLKASVFITELVMGFPIMWTALKALEMPRFLSWQQQHGGF